VTTERGLGQHDGDDLGVGDAAPVLEHTIHPDRDHAPALRLEHRRAERAAQAMLDVQCGESHRQRHLVAVVRADEARRDGVVDPGRQCDAGLVSVHASWLGGGRGGKRRRATA